LEELANKHMKNSQFNALYFNTTLEESKTRQKIKCILSWHIFMKANKQER